MLPPRSLVSLSFHTVKPVSEMKYFIHHKLTKESTPIDSTPNPSKSDPFEYNLPITEDEVRLAIDNSPEVSAPGGDQILFIFHPKTDPNSLAYLTLLLDKIFRNGTSLLTGNL